MPKLYSTRADTEGHFTCPPATRCHSCTEIEKGREKYKGQTNPQSLLFSVRPSDSLMQAMSAPKLRVAPQLSYGTDGSLRSSAAEVEEWVRYHTSPGT